MTRSADLRDCPTLRPLSLRQTTEATQAEFAKSRVKRAES